MLSNRTSSDRFESFVSLSALISAVFAVIGIVFIVIFYAGVGIFGPLSDVAYMTQMIFTLPIVFYMYRRLEPQGKSRALGVTLLGFLAMTSVITLQVLLITGVLPFTTQIGLLLFSILFIVLWFVLIERYGREDDVIPHSRLLAVLAGMTIGYPVWAYRFRRNLKDADASMILSEEPAT